MLSAALQKVQAQDRVEPGRRDRDRGLSPDEPVRQDIQSVAARYRTVRALSETLCESLETEDYVVQSMPDVSPTKWHLAHTSWFFETFVLEKGLAGYRGDPQYAFLFNSYYNTVGPMHCRPRRGLISRPTVKEAYLYRAQTDARMNRFFETMTERQWEEFAPIIELGLHHEQQHQELLLMDIKHVFAQNPLYPVYRRRRDHEERPTGPLQWMHYPGGVYSIGNDGKEFCFDNETPLHRVFLEPFQLASRPITNGEYLAFMEDGGYERPDLWLSLGWFTLQEQQWNAPLYWEKLEGEWCVFTLSGLRRIDPAEPVCHISYFEADAFARWNKARLPTEAEWEVASVNSAIAGNFVEAENFHPMASGLISSTQPAQMFGDVWEWTSSSYAPYPNYNPPMGALGEYNGKFMCNQYVLRGGCCVTSQTHIRRTYRNFFPPDKRWPFSGLRLAKGGE